MFTINPFLGGSNTSQYNANSLSLVLYILAYSYLDIPDTVCILLLRPLPSLSCRFSAATSHRTFVCPKMISRQKVQYEFGFRKPPLVEEKNTKKTSSGHQKANFLNINPDTNTKLPFWFFPLYKLYPNFYH